MKAFLTHRWDLPYGDARKLQTKLGEKVQLRSLPLGSVRFVAGADIAISKKLDCFVGAVVVLRFPELEVVDSVSAELPASFPYIPGLLSFREIPVLMKCLEKLSQPFDVLLCDGHGIAHPRGLGLASHVGVLLRKPTIGCAKSLFVGEHGSVGSKRSNYTALSYKGKRVGSVVRTRDNVKPMYISPGHLVDQPSCRRIALACTTRYRMPEPTRLADKQAGAAKRALEHQNAKKGKRQNYRAV